MIQGWLAHLCLDAKHSALEAMRGTKGRLGVAFMWISSSWPGRPFKDSMKALTLQQCALAFMSEDACVLRAWQCFQLKGLFRTAVVVPKPLCKSL